MTGESKGSVLQSFRDDKNNGSWINWRRYHGDNGTVPRLQELGLKGPTEGGQACEMIGGGNSILWKQR